MQASVSELTATQIPKPADEKAFEHCNEILWRCILQDETVKTYGRRGQKQSGVDLTGIRADHPDRIVGVQCKLKINSKTLTLDEIQDEVNKARLFRPHLSEYIIVTTAPDDTRFDKLALELSLVAQENGRRIKIRIFGWDILQREIRRHPRALAAFYPALTIGSAHLEQKIDALTHQLSQLSLPTASRVRDADRAISSLSTPLTSSVLTAALEEQVAACSNLASTDPHIALTLLRKLNNALPETVSATLRFRIATGIAGCQLRLGQDDEAASHFLDAFDLDSTNPDALANKALAFALRADWQSLVSFAETHVSQNSDNARLAAYYIQGLTADSTIEDPLPFVSDQTRRTPEVAEAHVRWLVARGAHGAWRTAAQKANEAHPDSEALRELYAAALLEPIVEKTGSSYGPPPAPEERADLEQAVSLYNSLWPAVRDADKIARTELLSIPINLIAAHRLLHDTTQAVTVARDAVQRFPGNADVQKQLAATLIEHGSFDEAQSLLTNLPDQTDVVMLRFSCAIGREDWSAIGQLATHHLPLIAETERCIALAARAVSRAQKARPEDRRTILAEEETATQHDARASVLLAQTCRSYGFSDLATTYFAASRSAFASGDDSYAARIAIAQEAAARGEIEIAIQILHGHIALDWDSPELRLLVHALVCEQPVRERAVDVIDNLPANLRNLPAFMRLEGILRTNQGMLHNAVGLFVGTFHSNPSIDNLMLLIDAYLRVDDKRAIAQLLRSERITEMRGLPVNRMGLAHIFMDFGEPDRALALGYETLLEDARDPSVVTKFFGLVLHSANDRREAANQRVAPGVWVRLIEKRGDVYEALVGEDTDRSWGKMIAADNAFIRKALGGAVGDSFEYTNTIGIEERWKIDDVKPTWLRAFHVLTQDFAQQFPDAKGFASMRMQGGDIEPILEQVRHRSEFLQTLGKYYLVGQVPIAFLARHRPGGEIALAQHLFSIGEGLRVCLGNTEELETALVAIKDHARRGAVLDALTAWYAATLDVLPILEERLGRLAIPHHEFARLQIMADDKMVGSGGEAMLLDYVHGRLVREIVSEEDQAAQADLVATRLAQIQRACAVEPVTVPEEMSAQLGPLLKLAARDAMTPMILAKRQRLLLCEDMMMRDLAKRTIDIDGVWIQAVLISARREGTIPSTKYCEAVVGLASIRNGYVFVSLEVLLSAFEDIADSGLRRLQALLRYVGSDGAEPNSHVETAARFLNAIAQHSVSSKARVRMASGLALDALLGSRAGMRSEWATALYARLRPRARMYILTWLIRRSWATNYADQPSGPPGKSGGGTLLSLVVAVRRFLEGVVVLARLLTTRAAPDRGTAGKTLGPNAKA